MTIVVFEEHALNEAIHRTPGFSQKSSEFLQSTSRFLALRGWQVWFSTAREFSQTLLRFSPGYEGTENMLCFF